MNSGAIVVFALWLIGWGFSMGLTVQKEWSVGEEFVQIFLLFFLWPVAMGKFVQKYLRKEDLWED